MEFKSQDVKAFMSQQTVGRVDGFGQICVGHIPADNSYGLQDMPVAITVSEPRGGDRDQSLRLQFENELKLRSLQHQNIIRLIGFSETEDNFYLVYEMLQARPLSEVIEGLTWKQALKVLKGIVSGLSFLHCREEGPFVHSNICMSNILVTEEFVPKLVDFRYCVVEGKRSVNTCPRYYLPNQEGLATVHADVYAFGLVALQLITKDVRTAFAVDEGSGLSLCHILELYLPMFREKRNLVHSSYRQENKPSKLTEMIFKCLEKNSKLDLKTFQVQLYSLTLVKGC